jgi:hypothetical protein
LFGEGRILFDPLVDVWGVEALRLDVVGCDAALDESVEYVARVLLLCVSFEWHGDLRWWGLELGREITMAGKGVDESDVGI